MALGPVWEVFLRGFPTSHPGTPLRFVVALTGTALTAPMLQATLLAVILSYVAVPILLPILMLLLACSATTDSPFLLLVANLASVSRA